MNKIHILSFKKYYEYIKIPPEFAIIMALYGEIFGHINIKKHYEDNKKMPIYWQMNNNMIGIIWL